MALCTLFNHFRGCRRGGGVGGYPNNIPQNDPDEALIILNLHNWGKNIFFKKNCPLIRAPISQGLAQRTGRGQNPFLCFSSIFDFSAKF